MKPDTFAEEYRVPLSVREILRIWTGDTYPICPRCHTTLEREYQSYCDRCGQCLDWKRLRHARIIFPVYPPLPGSDSLTVHRLGKPVALAGENNDMRVMDQPV